MGTLKFDVLTVPEILERDVECIRVIEYAGEQGVAINVSPNALPGIVFQHRDGGSAIENIVTPSGSFSPPTLFLYGPGIETSVMHYKKGAYTTTQVILKPHALQSLLGIDASELMNGHAELNQFSSEDLNPQLLEASDRERVSILLNFLAAKSRQAKTRDPLVEESLRLIHRDIRTVTVKHLLEELYISERQFERRFSQTVGIPPRSYIRVKRFNEAVRLMKTGEYQRLTDIAYALNFHDQSHFIRELKALSGMTPKNIAQQAGNFQEQGGFSYTER